MVSVSPAVTCVFWFVTAVPSALALFCAAASSIVKPFWVPPSERPTPILALLPLLLLFWLAASCALSRLMSRAAVSETFLPLISAPRALISPSVK
ncbi:hypothetical protein D3C86_1997600 [compost metagenome]